MPRRTLIAVVLALAALVVAGCGGASDSTDDSADGGVVVGGGKGENLSLVAYSTPEVVYDEIIPAFKKTEAGAGVSFKESFGASGEQSRAVEAGLPADVVSFSLEPDLTRLVDAGLVADGLGGHAVQGPGHEVRRRVHRPQGQPEAHQDLGRPAQAGRRGPHAEPVHLGRGEVEPARPAYGAKGLPYVEQAHQGPRQGAGQVGPRGAAELRLGHRRRPPLLRVRGDDRAEEGPGRRLRHPGRHDPHREPDRRDDEGAVAGARRSSTTSSPSPAQEKFAEWGYRPVDQQVFDEHKSKFPTPAKLRTIHELGGWSKVNDELFDPDKGSIAKIEEDAGVSTDK